MKRLRCGDLLVRGQQVHRPLHSLSPCHQSTPCACKDPPGASARRVLMTGPATARGSGRAYGPGPAQATLRFTAALRSGLRNASSLKLEISGYAVRGASAHPSAHSTSTARRMSGCR